MHNQTRDLSRSLSKNAPEFTLNSRSGTKVIAVTGGKGGIGKTNITLCMAVAMAKEKKRVMVLDADLGLANIDVLLGLRGEKNLSHVLDNQCGLDEILLEGPHGLKIIPASSGLRNMTELSVLQHAGLIRAFSELEQDVDVLLVDTAAGISNMVLNFSCAAQDILVVVCDEPTSITDAYALIKLLSKEYGVTRFKIVTNMVRSYGEGRELFAKLLRVTEKFLNANLELVACVPLDEKVRKAVKKQQLVIDSYPESHAAKAISLLAKKALTWPVPEGPNGHLEFFVEQLLK